MSPEGPFTSEYRPRGSLQVVGQARPEWFEIKPHQDTIAIGGGRRGYPRAYLASGRKQVSGLDDDSYFR
jgi:hypothetical protein